MCKTVEIIKERAFYSFTAETVDVYVGVVRLENDIFALVHEDGTAIGSDGKRYVRVSRETADVPIYADDPLLFVSFYDTDDDLPEVFPIPDTTLVTVGWTTDADKPVILGD